MTCLMLLKDKVKQRLRNDFGLSSVEVTGDSDKSNFIRVERVYTQVEWVEQEEKEVQTACVDNS